MSRNTGDGGDTSNSALMVVGIAVGLFIFIIIIVACICKNRRRNRVEEEEEVRNARNQRRDGAFDFNNGNLPFGSEQRTVTGIYIVDPQNSAPDATSAQNVLVVPPNDYVELISPNTNLSIFQAPPYDSGVGSYEYNSEGVTNHPVPMYAAIPIARVDSEKEDIISVV
eukprot:GILI01009410.1.p1 GENE.GILI01009410.1~~GILI01009410.1.p1  ORF type:complete len:168 (-),score=28.97 GILI01009410.1:82-585(-)